MNDQFLFSTRRFMVELSITAAVDSQWLAGELFDYLVTDESDGLPDVVLSVDAVEPLGDVASSGLRHSG